MEVVNEHHDHQAKVAILFRAFKERLGTKTPTQNHSTWSICCSPLKDFQNWKPLSPKKRLTWVINQMPSDKTPGPDGFNAEFLKHCSGIIAPDFYKLIGDFHSSNVNIESINYSFIILIPKIKASTSPTDFRPISLLNCTLPDYKLTYGFYQL